jgi:hypothetical protein
MAVLPSSKGKNMSKNSDNLDTSGERGRGGWTPGPWELMVRHYDKAKYITADDCDYSICSVTDYADMPWEANAKLIAAAPDLLEALKALCDIRGEDLCYAYSEWEAAHQAIKKATGE